MTISTGTRLPAAERRQALVETAMRAFSAGSYRGVTTAEIAREAGVSEPILYRHFSSKRDLFLASLDEAWRGLREGWEAALAETDDPALWVRAMGRVAIACHREKVVPPALWVQALTEAGEDGEIRSYIRAHMQVVHDHVAAVVRRAQELGGIDRERDPDAEAWIFIGIGLLATFAQRLGGVLREDDLHAIAASRSAWLTGR